MTRTDPQMKVRLPAALKEFLVKESKKNGRTLNAEIVHRLQRTLTTEAPSESGNAMAEMLSILRDLHGAAKSPGPPKTPLFKKKK